MRKEPEYWNHNTAYYPWIKKQLKHSNRMLDIGCGDGCLIRYLEDDSKIFLGIDRESVCIDQANEQSHGSSASFVCCDFEDFQADDLFDAIVFVASIHHMDMRKAIKKAKAMLSENGILIVVGLAKPSNFMDYLIEALRVLPCMIQSKIKKIRSSEDNDIPVSYRLPSLDEVRKVIAEELPGCEFRMGLYFRYLLKWEKSPR